MMKLWSVVLVAMLAFAHPDADARRMGGGKSVGKQSSNVTQRDAATPPATPGAPAQTATNAAAAKPAAAAPAAAAKKPWGAMLGGLAAGLGLAWLASSLGLGAGFANILMITLLARTQWWCCCPKFTLRLPGRRGGFASFRPGAAPVQPRQGGQRCFGPPLGAQWHGV